MIILKNYRNKPPAAIEVERMVLGAMLIDGEAVPKAVEILKPENFYDKKHGFIFDAIVSLYNSNEPVDTVTLYEELKKSAKLDEVGGATFISKLSEDISSAANIDFHARVILEKWILRKLISTSFEIASDAFQGQEDVFDILDQAESKIFSISEQSTKESFKSMDKAVREALELIEAIHNKNISTFSVPSGYLSIR
ncbi:MAG: DnaB-like helicase N-terminal domain-containing protein [Melioribacteraceae bacterium]|nr:DnaB-like helicase N-terminal domain-containing protein [Melioribacteraceae bacterium]